MHTLKHFAVLTASLVVLSALEGCILVAAAAGAAGVAYVNGDLEATLDANPRQVVDAAAAAFKDMNIEIQSSSSTDVDGRVLGRTAMRKVEITVKCATDKSSQISIRVDTFGDEAMSRQILDKIKARL